MVVSAAAEQPREVKLQRLLSEFVLRKMQFIRERALGTASVCILSVCKTCFCLAGSLLGKVGQQRLSWNTRRGGGPETSHLKHRVTWSQGHGRRPLGSREAIKPVLVAGDGLENP